MPEWDAEVEVDEELARELIAGRFPHLDAHRLTKLGEGWDNTVWCTADAIAFRFPRRAVALAGVAREMALLPELAARLPAAIPTAAYPGVADGRFPWPWFGSALISGAEVCDARAGDRTALAADLGAFLRALHQISPTTALPGDFNRRADMAARVARTRAALTELGAHWPRSAESEPVLAAAAKLGPSTERVLVHGDLHCRHLLVDDAGRLAGVIDWGDACLAPRSLDLSPFWSLFTPAERRAFLTVYGELDPDTLLRARVLALFFGAILAAYALDKGWAALAAEALAGLDRTLMDA